MVFFAFGCRGRARYFSAKRLIASSSRSFAVRSLSVTRWRSVFHFSTVRKACTAFFPMRSGRVTDLVFPKAALRMAGAFVAVM